MSISSIASYEGRRATGRSGLVMVVRIEGRQTILSLSNNADAPHISIKPKRFYVKNRFHHAVFTEPFSHVQENG